MTGWASRRPPWSPSTATWRATSAPKGIRSNLVSAGPIKTIAAGSIPGFELLAQAWDSQAPLAWDTKDAGPVADACLFLMSGLARGVTGEIVHVDGGYHALGAPLSPPRGGRVAGRSGPGSGSADRIGFA